MCVDLVGEPPFAAPAVRGVFARGARRAARRPRIGHLAHAAREARFVRRGSQRRRVFASGAVDAAAFETTGNLPACRCSNLMFSLQREVESITLPLLQCG